LTGVRSVSLLSEKALYRADARRKGKRIGPLEREVGVLKRIGLEERAPMLMHDGESRAN
jgi:hypothetical protein